MASESESTQASWTAPGLAPDSDADDDGDDSAYDDASSLASETGSVASSVYHYRLENGRTYHAYKDGTYAYPNDEMELDRLDLQHHLFLLTLDGKLFLSPLIGSPQEVLDIATGTGIWAIDFADEHSASSIVANDLSPCQPELTPPNLAFEVDDANEPWTYSRRFDFIHVRQHHCAIEERRLFAQGMEFLKPGGWMEMQELGYPMGCDDGTLPADSALCQWSQLLMDATAKLGQGVDKPAKYAAWMREAGFVHVRKQVFKWPTNSWPRDKKEKTMGMWNLHNVLQGVQGFTIALFTRVLGWSRERVEVFLVDVRADLRNRRIHAYWPIYVTYGQRPAPDEGHGTSISSADSGPT